MKTTLRFATVLSALALGLGVSFTAHAQEMTAAPDTTDPVPAYTPPAVVDASPVKLPKMTRKTLSNGLVVYYIPQHEVPVVTVRLNFPTGALYNPMDKPGLTTWTFSRPGTARRKASCTSSGREEERPFRYISSVSRPSGSTKT